MVRWRCTYEIETCLRETDCKFCCGKDGADMGGRHSNQKLDLTGQRFGRLTVLEPAVNVGTKTAWLCRCDCGKDAVVVTQRLRDGHRTSF